MKTILKTDRGITCCFVCEIEYGLETHHVYMGNPNREISDKNGFTVKLCSTHHREGSQSAHKNRNLDLTLKELFQRIYEENHSREEFIKLISRSYL